MTMTQIALRPGRERFAEPASGATLALWRTLLAARRPCRTLDTGIEIVRFALLAPALIVIGAVTLVALLGYFVVWLCFVAVLLAGTVIADRVIG
jgi:hypothetical protein